ncbi:hypothetical protein, partial [Vibrio parahaemolyticus]|uniref:hypothetical protein n=1 Tax=Vibrio parahaemolyticus TaxID=670 RepID=UPI001C60E045
YFGLIIVISTQPIWLCDKPQHYAEFRFFIARSKTKKRKLHQQFALWVCFRSPPLAATESVFIY